MSSRDGIERVCKRLREIHAEILESTGVNEVELLEAATAIQEIEDAADDLINLDRIAEEFNKLRDVEFQARYMRHEMDVAEGLNVYHPINRGDNGIAIYIPDCFYLHLKYRTRRRKDPSLQQWSFDWEWRPNKEIIRAKVANSPKIDWKRLQTSSHYEKARVPKMGRPTVRDKPWSKRNYERLQAEKKAKKAELETKE